MKEYREDLGNITLEMVSIPDGSFLMGSPNGEGNEDEYPQHEVTVPGFFMGKYLVTQAQWRIVSAEFTRVERDLIPIRLVSKGKTVRLRELIGMKPWSFASA